ncbi:MAG: WD40 repeat domain-containing protein [Acidimicrobiia bacterium]
MPRQPACRRRRRGAPALLVALLAALLPVLSRAPAPAWAAPANTGYWLVASDGGVFTYGDAGFFGSTGDVRLNKPIVGMASSPSGGGYWMVATDGGIFTFGDAGFHGSTGAVQLNRPIVGMAPTPTGAGYWLVASDGGIFSFGDAGFFGSTGDVRLNKPIVGMSATPSGDGYWLVASDGGIFAFGDAAFHGSTGAVRLNRPITGMATTPSGGGYWLTASDGGVFSFGDAGFFGAAPDRAARPGGSRTVVSMVPTASGAGYWQVSAEGEVLAFGDAGQLGAPAALNRAVVGMASIRRSNGPASVGPASPGGAASPDPVSQGDSDQVPAPTPPPSTTTTTTPGPRPLRFANVPNPTWGSGEGEGNKAGRVLAVIEVGNTLYMGGEFTTVTPPGAGVKGPPTPRAHFAALDVTTGELLAFDPGPDGPVRAFALSADGQKLFVGGTFNTMAGVPAKNLTVLDLASGQFDPTFIKGNPNSGVRALALRSDRLYAAGNFDTITRDGVEHSRSQVAAYDTGTGALVDTFVPPGMPNGEYVGQTGEESSSGNGIVYTLGVSRDGTMLHVGGTFLDFGGQDGLVTLDTATGEPSAWQGSMERPVFGMDMAPDGHTFYVATGGPGGRLYKFVPGADADAEWEARTDGDATDVIATEEVIYLLGHYDYIILDKDSDCYQYCPDDGNPNRRHLAAFDPANGNLDGWNATANTPQGPYHGYLGAHHLYIAGDFTEINGDPHPGIAQFRGA